MVFLGFQYKEHWNYNIVKNLIKYVYKNIYLFQIVWQK